ncbi:MAG: signal peptidase II [Verrucomicrobia bacterium]|nr:MAG: signal peptidase II [Verrucomicrobiota bacterium]
MANHTPRNPGARICAYRWFFLIAVLIFAGDQVSKLWIHKTLPFNSYYPPDAITVIPGFFNIVHVGNTGAAWGLFAGGSFWLALLAIATLLAIFIFRRHLTLKRPLVQFSFGLLCGGIVGNLVDRILHGHVIDFLDFHFGSFVWPAFNLADAAICIGVGLYILHTFREPEPAKR